MKKVIITCDVCQKQLSNEYIKLGSENEQELCFENKLSNREIGETINIARYRDLHFCCKEHFIKYFFNRYDPDNCHKKYNQGVCYSCEFRKYELVTHPGFGCDNKVSVQKEWCDLGYWEDYF